MLSNKMIYIGLLAAQFLTFVAYAVVTAGAALLQKKANKLTLFDDPKTLEATLKAYDDVFQSTGYIIPYPQRHKYQFQYQWWIIEMEFAVFALTAFLTLFPAYIPRARPVALSFLSAALVLVMDNINAVFYVLRSDLAKQVFDKHRIETTQAGLIMVGIANCLTIIFLGLYEHEPSSAATVDVGTTKEAKRGVEMTADASAANKV